MFFSALVDDFGEFVWMDPAQSCLVAGMTRTLIQRSGIFEPPKVWVSDIAAHFKKGLMIMIEEA